MISPHSQDAFTIERHGELTLIRPSSVFESLGFELDDQTTELIIEPLRQQEGPLVVFDLRGVPFFGSLFIQLLLRCWKLALVQGGMMVLAGVSDPARELLRLTSLDIVWPIYTTPQEAIDALLSD